MVRVIERLTRSRPHSYQSLAWIFAIAQWPLAFNIALALLAPSLAATNGKAFFWFASLGSVNWLMLVAASTAWRFASGRLTQVDAIMVRSSRRSQVAEWLTLRMSTPQQIALPLVGTLTSPLYVLFVREELGSIVEVNLASYALVAWTSFIGGNVCYWLWVASGIPREIHRVGNLDLRWHDPASTPGIRLLVDGYTISGVFLLLGVVSISILGFIAPKATEVEQLRWLLYVFFAVAVGVAVRVGIVTLYWTWRMVVDHKRATLETVSAKVGSFSADKPLPQRTLHWLDVYGRLSMTSSLPFSTAGVIQYGATILGAVIAFIIGQATGF